MRVTAARRAPDKAAMTDSRHDRPNVEFGLPLDTALARRERLADNYALEYGQERVFPALVHSVLEEVPEGSDVLEVGAATGLMTGPLVDRAGRVTALEPSAGMLRRLLAKDVANSARLETLQGLVEDLPATAMYDVAVVTFTPRRGLGLLRLLLELAGHVRDRIVMMLDDDTMDWAYLAKSGAARGLDVRLHFVTDRLGVGGKPFGARAIVLTAVPLVQGDDTVTPDDWAFDAREVTVPYPMPRGTATRLVRFLLAGGDRALLVHTDPEGVERLYGNLRTAVHRLGRSELTVRRDGPAIKVVRLPKGGEPE